MAKEKILTLEISPEQESVRNVHYERMGLVCRMRDYCEMRNQDDCLIRAYYRNTYTFDQTQRNGKEKWSCYKKYNKLLKKLEFHKKNRVDGYPLHPQEIIKYSIISAVFLIPLFAVLFVHWDMFWGDDLLNILVGGLVGVSCGPLAGVIWAFIRMLIRKKRWRMEAVVQIPRLEKELEELSLYANSL